MIEKGEKLSQIIENANNLNENDESVLENPAMSESEKMIYDKLQLHFNKFVLYRLYIF